MQPHSEQAQKEQPSDTSDLSLSERRDRLIALGIESLADGLLDLCAYSPEAEKLVERLISTPKENSLRFRKRIAALKKATGYFDYNGASTLARQLQFLLTEIERGVADPVEGLDLVHRFFETDASTFERCDDSMGSVGEVYRTDATELFSKYAKECEDKKLIAKMMVDLQRNNDYGVRDCLVDTSNTCLPEKIMRDMIDTFLELAKQESEKYSGSNFYISAESLAKQLKDAHCFESIRRSFRGELSTSSYIDIAEVYLDSGAVDVALQWLDRIGANDLFRHSQRDALYAAAYRANGDTDSLIALLRKHFQDSPNKHTLQALLNEVGEDKRIAIVEEQVYKITDNKTLNTSDASFLVSVGAIDKASDYIVNRAEQLEGGAYIGTSDLAMKFTAANYPLAASLLFRCLLAEILEDGRTKAYSHGARYLSALDRLAKSITDWKTHPDHVSFKADIRDRHSRKRSFWAKYSDKH